MRAPHRLPALLLSAVGLLLPLALATPAHAAGMRAMDDRELAGVQGRDGLAFNLAGFSLGPSSSGGNYSLTYVSPASTAAQPSTLTLSNFTLSRSDDADPFADPYTLDVNARPGLADVISIAFPKNLAANQKWQFGTELAVDANGLKFDAGHLGLTDLVFYGGGLDISTPATPGVDGVAFGLATRFSLAALTVRPRGSADASEQLQLSGLRLGNSTQTAPWVISDITRQPGLFNAITDADGRSALHLQIAWPTTADPVPIGALEIDRIAFTSNGVTTDFGSSRIAGIQLNFVDIKFRAGP